MNLSDDTKITVCDACLCACCIQGDFYCDDYEIAGITLKTIKELKSLKLEHSDYWLKDVEIRNEMSQLSINFLSKN